MSAHTRRKAQRKYKQRLLSERETNQPSINTTITLAGPVWRLQERWKLHAAHSVKNGASTDQC